MTYATNRNIPAAKAIDDYQDSIADPNVRQGRDYSGAILLSLPALLLIAGVVAGLVERFWS